MRLKFRVSRAAARDLDMIAGYLASESPHAAKLVLGRVRKTMRLLAVYPLAGQEFQNLEDVRQFPVPRTKLSLVYRIKGEAVELVRVYHQSRNWSLED